MRVPQLALLLVGTPSWPSSPWALAASVTVPGLAGARSVSSTATELPCASGPTTQLTSWLNRVQPLLASRNSVLGGTCAAMRVRCPEVSGPRFRTVSTYVSSASGSALLGPVISRARSAEFWATTWLPSWASLSLVSGSSVVLETVTTAMATPCVAGAVTANWRVIRPTLSAPCAQIATFPLILQSGGASVTVPGASRTYSTDSASFGP